MSVTYTYSYTDNSSFGTLNLPQSDYNRESSSTRFYCYGPGSGITLTPSQGSAITKSIDSTDLTNLLTLWWNFVNGAGSTTAANKKANGATLGYNGKPTFSAKANGTNVTNYYANVPGEAQRELKWRITLQEDIDNGEIFTYDIPCCNASILTGNTEKLPKTQEDALTAFLAGPSKLIAEGGTDTVNIPMIVSKNSHPLKYVTSSIVGVRFKKN